MKTTFTIRDVERAVCLRFKLTPERLKSAERQRKIMRPRQIAMFLSREFTTASLPQIGRHFARDHTTVLHGCKKIAAMAAGGGRMETYLNEIRAILATLTPVKEAIAAQICSQHSPAILPRAAEPLAGEVPVAPARREGRRGQ